MTATLEWRSSAFDSSYPPPAFLRASATGSDVYADARTADTHVLTDTHALIGQSLIPLSRREESATFVTTPSKSFPGSNDSSAAFTPGGRTPTTFQAYRRRIEALRSYAAQDGYFLSSSSEFDFWRFVGSERRLRRGNLVLIDNGNLRAVWKDGQGTHLGLQFLGGGMVQYVIFKQRQAEAAISRVAGRDTFEGVKRQIDAFDLQSLLYE